MAHRVAQVSVQGTARGSVCLGLFLNSTLIADLRSRLQRNAESRLTVRFKGEGSSLAMSADVWKKIEAVYSKAETSGSLYQIHTKPEALDDATRGLRFQLQISEALRSKPKAKPSDSKPPEDAFARPDEDLSVDEDFSATHTLRLNKFNVVPFHSLVITKHFEAQTDRLNEADWSATLKAMQAYPEGAFAYYNGGEDSGSSQPRKHLQILPVALEGIVTAPFPFEQIAEEAFEAAGRDHLQAVRLKSLPFQSFLAALPDRPHAGDLQLAYQNLMAARLPPTEKAHYNILLSQKWMLLVPRKQESCGPVGCNALVFAGTFLVRSHDELDFIRSVGPMHILQDVAFPWRE